MLFRSRKVGVSRTQLYMTHTIKRNLPSAHSGAEKQLIAKSEVLHWYDILKQEISLLPNCEIIIVLGNHAMTALTGNTGITNWRGSVVDAEIRGRKYKVICTVNPNMVFREPKLEILFRMDVAKLGRVMSGEFQVPVFRELINPTFAEASEYLDHVHARGLAGHFVSTDIESMGNETASVGFAASDDEAMCIAFRNLTDHVYSPQDEAVLRGKMQGILADRQIKRIAQNGNFDAYWMGYKDSIRWGDIYLDTMLAHFTLYPPLPHNLGFLTTQYTDHPYYKDDGKTWRDTNNLDQFWRYNCKDAVLTRMIAKKLLVELREQKMDDAYFSHVARLGRHLVSMTVNGVLIDQTLKDKLNEILSADVARLEKDFQAAVVKATGNDEYKVNPNSPTQISKLLFTELRLVGRGLSTGAENRDRILANPRTDQASRDVLTVLGEYKEKTKFLSTYVESKLDEDGRMRCEYKQHGVVRAPGRLSSAKVLWGSGMNLQNQNEASKAMFIADPGYMFTYFDMAQIEARLVAYFAGIESWKEQFNKDLMYRRGLSDTPFDAHRALAAEIWKIPYDEVPKEDFLPDGTKTIRYKGKRARHGLNYRMEPDRFATTAGLTLSEAKDIYDKYHYITPELKRWWQSVVDEARSTKQLFTPYGTRWVNLGRFDDDAADSIIAFKPQSTAGVHVARVIYLCHEDPDWPRDARIVLNIHDALIALHKYEDRVIVRQIMRKYAEAPIMINGEECICPCDFAKSVPDEHGLHRWSTLKKIKSDED